MTRQLRPSDIRTSVIWYTGCNPDHERYGPRASKRVLAAKRLYWAALREIGLSWLEIGAETGANARNVQRTLDDKPVPVIFVAGVLERAREQVAAEVNA